MYYLNNTLIYYKYKCLSYNVCIIQCIINVILVYSLMVNTLLF